MKTIIPRGKYDNLGSTLTELEREKTFIDVQMRVKAINGEIIKKGAKLTHVDTKRIYA